jgi:thioredoxin-like negative regulator of GroEL
MWERILMAIAIVGLGVLAYRLFLRAQRRRAARGSLERAAGGRAAVLVFTSPTCAPCKLQQLPIVDRILLDWHDKIEVEIVDVTEKPEAATQYGVWSLPTTIVLDAQRKVIAINQGVAHEHRLREQMARAAGAEQMPDRRGEKEWQPS